MHKCIGSVRLGRLGHTPICEHRLSDFHHALYQWHTSDCHCLLTDSSKTVPICEEIDWDATDSLPRSILDDGGGGLFVIDSDNWSSIFLGE